MTSSPSGRKSIPHCDELVTMIRRSGGSTLRSTREACGGAASRITEASGARCPGLLGGAERGAQQQRVLDGGGAAAHVLQRVRGDRPGKLGGGRSRGSRGSLHRYAPCVCGRTVDRELRDEAQIGQATIRGKARNAGSAPRSDQSVGTFRGAAQDRKLAVTAMAEAAPAGRRAPRAELRGW